MAVPDWSSVPVVEFQTRQRLLPGEAPPLGTRQPFSPLPSRPGRQVAIRSFLRAFCRNHRLPSKRFPLCAFTGSSRLIAVKTNKLFQESNFSHASNRAPFLLSHYPTTLPETRVRFPSPAPLIINELQCSAVNCNRMAGVFRPCSGRFCWNLGDDISRMKSPLRIPEVRSTETA